MFPNPTFWAFALHFRKKYFKQQQAQASKGANKWTKKEQRRPKKKQADCNNSFLLASFQLCQKLLPALLLCQLTVNQFFGDVANSWTMRAQYLQRFITCCWSQHCWRASLRMLSCKAKGSVAPARQINWQSLFFAFLEPAFLNLETVRRHHLPWSPNGTSWKSQNVTCPHFGGQRAVQKYNCFNQLLDFAAHLSWQ